MLDLENNQPLENRIERYVKEEMIPSERSDFEAEITQNKELALEVKRRQQLIFVLQNESTFEAFNMMKNIMETPPQPSEEVPNEKSNTVQKLNSNWFKGLGLLAIVSFLALSIYLFLPGPSSNQSQISYLVKVFASPYPNKFTELPPQTPLERGMTAYLADDYRIAIRELKFHVKNDATNVGTHFYLGLSYFLYHKETEAIPLFEKVIEESLVFKEPSQWYLALTYLSMQEYEKARPLLKALRETQYEEDANRLLKLLE
jgi:tetratricopeptide (TPR) repeat protein